MHAGVRPLPPRDRVLADVARAERDAGWMAQCVDAGCYVALTSQFVESLATQLRALAEGQESVLEVCGGDGRLAAALRAQGVSIIATDAAPPPGAEDVVAMNAIDALRHYQPAVVLGAFVPFDSGVDRAVLALPTVRSYVVLNARTGGEFGPSALWNAPGWQRRHLGAVTKDLVTRHDAWLGDDVPVRQYGEAWLLRRATGSSTTAAQAASESIG